MQSAAIGVLLGLVLPAVATAASLRGTVVDPQGRPVPGASVIAAGPLAGAATTTTDDAGRFAISGLDAGRYDVLVLIAGFRADPLTVELADGDDREITLALRLSAIAESVVVTASPMELPLSRASDSVTVIPRSELLSRQIDTAADALRPVPGLTLSRTGGRSGVTSLFSRGGESDFTLVLIDGVKVNAFGGGYDFSDLPVHDIERIEVVRGPQSALFGADAIGSVVQIVTRHGGPARADAVVEAGGFGTTRLAASASGHRGAWTFGASAERLASDGYTGIAPASGEEVSNDDGRYSRGAASLGWRAAGGADLRTDIRLGSSNRGFPGPYGSDPIGAFPGVDRISRGRMRTVQASGRLTLPFARPARGARQLFEAGYYDAASDFTSPFGDSETSSRRLSLRSQTDIAVSGSMRLSGGVELLRERATSTYITGSSAALLPITRVIAGAFGEARYEPTRRLVVAAGLRAEYIRRDALDGVSSPFFTRPSFPAESTTSVNPKVSAAWWLRREAIGHDGRPPWLSGTRLRAGAGTGMRAPDAFEIAFTDNATLKPERSKSAELAVEQRIAGDAVRLELAAFANRYDDLIVAVGPALADLSRYRTDNIANASAGGLEASGAFRTAWGLEARVGYTYLRTRVLAVDRGSGQAPPPFRVGDPLVRRPLHQGFLDVVLARGRVTTFAQVGSRGRTLDIEPNYGAFGGLFSNPGYAVVNAGAAVRLARGLELLGRVTNLFDATYEEALGYPAPGRAVTIGVRVAAGR